eukprot:67175-Chlamydomonas_euryale.AAC.2
MPCHPILFHAMACHATAHSPHHPTPRNAEWRAILPHATTHHDTPLERAVAPHLCTQVYDASAPQAVLHARLDHEAQVHQRKALAQVEVPGTAEGSGSASGGHWTERRGREGWKGSQGTQG